MLPHGSRAIPVHRPNIDSTASANPAWIVSGMPVKYVSRDIGPKLAKYVGESIAGNGISILHREIAARLAARVVADRNSLCNPAAEYFGCVKAGVAVIIRRDHHPRCRVDGPLEHVPRTFGIVAFILMKDGGHDENDPVVAIRLVKKAAPVVSAVPREPIAQFLVRIRAFGQRRRNPDEKE